MAQGVRRNAFGDAGPGTIVVQQIAHAPFLQRLVIAMQNRVVVAAGSSRSSSTYFTHFPVMSSAASRLSSSLVVRSFRVQNTMHDPPTNPF